MYYILIIMYVDLLYNYIKGILTTDNHNQNLLDLNWTCTVINDHDC